MSATSCGAYASDGFGPGAAGQVFEQTITYDFGNKTANSALFLQPTGNHDFNDLCCRLVGSEIIQSNVPGVPVGATDRLYFPTTVTAQGTLTKSNCAGKFYAAPEPSVRPISGLKS